MNPVWNQDRRDCHILAWCMLHCLNAMDRNGSSDSSQVQHLLTSWQSTLQLSLCVLVLISARLILLGSIYYFLWTISVVDLAQNFFIFMQFSGKIGPIIGWRPSRVGAPREILDPPPYFSFAIHFIHSGARYNYPQTVSSFKFQWTKLINH